MSPAPSSPAAAVAMDGLLHPPEALQVLCRIAMMKDGATADHVIRMSQIAGVIGARYGLSATETDLLVQAAPLHDIGKIAIPEAILLKPGKLLDDEMRVMRTHAQIGHDLLIGLPSPELRLGADIALNHHEKWDGSGYPSGKRGSEISISARIVAVADVLDALASRRPYKEAWALEDAIRYVEDASGTHFDPEVVLCVRPCQAAIQAILAAFSTEWVA